MSGIVHNLPEADYHAHPALSSTGARKLLPPSCPAKFEWERRHPTPPTRAMREGHAAHRMILGVGVEVVPVMGYDDWRTKAAQDQRKEIESSGRVALRHEGKAPALVAGFPRRRCWWQRRWQWHRGEPVDEGQLEHRSPGPTRPHGPGQSRPSGESCGRPCWGHVAGVVNAGLRTRPSRVIVHCRQLVARAWVRAIGVWVLRRPYPG